MSHNYQVIARKFRPQRFSEIVGQEPIITTMKNAIEMNRIAHAYLFCGTHGTGKTTLARLFAKVLNCESLSADLEPCNKCTSCTEITSSHSLNVLEIDGASNRGIDDIRQINDTVAFSAGKDQYKIYIVDEVHMLTKEAFNALLKTLEEPPAHVKFFFATTEPHKLPLTILSRCQRFDLARIPLEKIKTNLKSVCNFLKLSFEEEALIFIANRSQGSLRDAQSLLDQVISYSDGKVTSKTAHSALGFLPKEKLLDFDQKAKVQNLAFIIQFIDEVFHSGMNLTNFLDNLSEHYRNILLTKVLKENKPPLHLSESDWDKYVESATLYSQNQCLSILEKIINTQNQLKKSLSNKLLIEKLLIDIAQSHQAITIDKLVFRLNELEKKLSLTKDTKPPPPIRPASPIVESPPIQEKPVTPPPIQQKLKNIQKNVTKPLIKGDEINHQNRYDTLMQFAAVELEGTVSKKNIEE